MASPADRALEQLAARQAQRRNFNERLAALGGADEAYEAMPIRCECGLIACGTTIRLTRHEYEELRAEPRRFAVLAEHVIPDVERVVASRRGWVTVETHLQPAGHDGERARPSPPPARHDRRTDELRRAAG